MTEHDKLQQRLVVFGSKLTPEQCKEFRAILDDFAKLHYDVGEAYKMAVIELIPSKLQSNNTATSSPTTVSQNSFKPTIKPITDKGNPLAELLHNMNNQDAAKLAESLKQNLKDSK